MDIKYSHMSKWNYLKPFTVSWKLICVALTTLQIGLAAVIRAEQNERKSWPATAGWFCKGPTRLF